MLNPDQFQTIMESGLLFGSDVATMLSQNDPAVGIVARQMAIDISTVYIAKYYKLYQTLHGMNPADPARFAGAVAEMAKQMIERVNAALAAEPLKPPQ